MRGPTPPAPPAADTSIGIAPPTPKVRYLTRDDVNNVDDHVEEDVEIPEWGGWLRVKGLTGSERDLFEGSIVDVNAKGDRRMNVKGMRAKLMVMSVVHPPGHKDAGERVYTDLDADWLGEKSAAAVDRVFTVAQRLAGLSDEDVEELKKRLETAPDGSTSDSVES